MRINTGKGVFLPADDEARELFKKHQPGTVLEIDVLNPRNAAFNNKVWATISKLAQALGLDDETMKLTLLVATGRFKLVKVNDKRVIVVPSMSKRAMSMAQLEDFFGDIKYWVSNHEALSPEARQEIEKVMA